MPRLNSDLDRALSVFNGPDRSEITLSELVVWDKIAWLLKRHRELHRRAQLAESRVATLQNMFKAQKNVEKYYKELFEYARWNYERYAGKYHKIWMVAYELFGKRVYENKDDREHVPNLLRSRLKPGFIRTLISKVW